MYSGSIKTACAQTVFVKASTSGVKNDEDMKLKAITVTPTRTPGAIS